MKSSIYPWLTALTILMATTANAREPTTVLVSKPEGGGASSQGSGVLCGSSPDGRKRVVLTVHHVVGPRGSMVYVKADPKRNVLHQGVVVGSDRESDAALVLIGGSQLEHVPDALLWHGPIDKRQTVRAEGFASGQYRETVGRPLYRPSYPPGSYAVSAPAMSGMSGGPIYISRKGQTPPRFVLLTTGSSGNFTIGPYRTFLVRFIEQHCSSPNFNFQVRGGSVAVIPKAPIGNELEGGLDKLAPPTDSKEGEVSLEDLKKQLADLLESRPAADPVQVPEVPPVQIQPTPSDPPARIQPTPSTIRSGVKQDVIEIPLIVKIKTGTVVEVSVPNAGVQPQ